ncbi:hypothetical protein DFQ28_000482 [Apophysomyces sp. BC1034]|nr:hypothetical protein DFQ28_000482 [Apophysomyces sp. BC1034]
MDIKARETLSHLITSITETGEWTLDNGVLKSIKRICKTSDENVDVAFDLIFIQLKKQHAQIRYSSLQLIESLFQRSHHFRILLTEEFQLFLQLTVGIHQHKLPPPMQVAAKLKQYAIALVKEWLKKFGDTYRPIELGYDYLDQRGLLACCTSLQSIHEHEQDRSGRETRIKRIQKGRFDQIKMDIEEHLDLIHENLRNMLSILNNQKIMSHGLGSNRYKITIDLSEDSIMDQIQETEDNEVVYEQLREIYKVLETKNTQQVNAWINALIKMDRTDKSGRETLIKQLIDVKATMADVLRKAKLLGITASQHDKHHLDGETDEDNDEFVDEIFEDVEVPDLSILTSKENEASSNVNKTIYSANLPPAQRIFPLAYEPIMSEDVTYSGARAISSKANLTSEPKQKGKEKEDPIREVTEHLKRAPVVEWGDDLYYWDKKSVQFNISGIERAHRFMGVGEGAHEMPEHLLDELRKRTIYYKTESPQTLEPCRAPLRSGGLCPRRDLVTCPFHGKIIPRDDIGRPLDSASQVQEGRLVNGDGNNSHSLWQEIEKDVMQQSGQEHISRKTRQRKKKQTALIDVRKKKETSYSRLQKKVADPKVKRLVEQAADSEQSNKLRNLQVTSWEQ